MSKKDYEKAASIVQGQRRATTDHASCVEAVAVENAFVRLFHEDGNPHFDEQRFRRACVPGANVRARR